MNRKIGLSHLDEEGVIGQSSAYRGTPERPNATKKPHKMEKTAEKSAVFVILKSTKLYFIAIRCLLFKVAFILR